MRCSTTVFAALPLLTMLAACGGAEARAKPTPEDASKVQPTRADHAAPATADERVRLADMARIKGDSNAKVWLVIVSDWQCPYCKLWHDSSAATIEKDYVATGKVRLAYVNFPLKMHQHAHEASEAAMCAGAQGKFWEYGERLFATQQQWAPLPSARGMFDSLASAVGVDIALWRTCMTDHVMNPMIDADYDRGVKANVNSTPTFFVGQQVLEGAQPVSAFRAAIDKALAAPSK